MRALNQTALGRPGILIAHTIKGKGAGLLEEGSFEWHHRSPSDEEYAAISGALR
jgi:transketolase